MVINKKGKSNPGWTPHGIIQRIKSRKSNGVVRLVWSFESAGLKLENQGQRIMVLCPFENHTTGVRGTYLFPGKEGAEVGTVTMHIVLT